MPIAAEYPFLELVGTMLVFFGFVMWIWLLFWVFRDLFARHDISGWGKAGWTVCVIVIPLIGVLVYLMTQGRGMSERERETQRAAKAQFNAYVRDVAGSEGPAAEIASAKQLRDSGAIDQAEFDRLKQRARG
jgi:uncharacterized membrane protein YcjF (UPF0283 family)